MIEVSFRILSLQKLYPLAISRGVTSGSDNLYVFARDGEHVGIGELSPATASDWTAQRGESQLEAFVRDTFGTVTEPLPPAPLPITGQMGRGENQLSIAEVWQRMRDRGIDPPAMAALDVALWDLFAKQCGQPLFRVFGLPNRCVPTSVTIGINPPEVIRERVPKILEQTGGRYLKIKLGSPDGVEADKANFEAAREAAAPFRVGLRVDANGGWSLSDATAMLRWLAERGVDYVEQPLVEGAVDQLPELYASRALPIFVDESCRFSPDVTKVADRVDGVNLKLMKCGGLTEALRIVATARAHGLKTMIGCMSESSIAIGAGAAIGSLFDHIDLDSHLNLNPDPAEGVPLVEGVVSCREAPGHGASLKVM